MCFYRSRDILDVKKIRFFIFGSIRVLLIFLYNFLYMRFVSIIKSFF